MTDAWWTGSRYWLEAPRTSDKTDSKTPSNSMQHILFEGHDCIVMAPEDYDELELRLRAAESERDLAIAHDRQPYPTAWAYEQLCKAHKALQSRLAGERESVDPFNEYYWIWQYADGSIHDELYMTEQFCRLEADEEQAADPSLGKISVVQVKIVRALAAQPKETK